MTDTPPKRPKGPEGEGEMTANLLPRIFTIDIGDTPTPTFEVQNLREAQKLCHEQWLKDDLVEAKSGGVPLWVGRPSCGHGWRCPTRAPFLPKLKKPSKV
jgi:hypothetical protein